MIAMLRTTVTYLNNGHTTLIQVFRNGREVHRIDQTWRAAFLAVRHTRSMRRAARRQARKMKL